MLSPFFNKRPKNKTDMESKLKDKGIVPTASEGIIHCLVFICTSCCSIIFDKRRNEEKERKIELIFGHRAQPEGI